MSGNVVDNIQVSCKATTATTSWTKKALVAVCWDGKKMLVLEKVVNEINRMVIFAKGGGKLQVGTIIRKVDNQGKLQVTTYSEVRNAADQSATYSVTNENINVDKTRILLTAKSGNDSTPAVISLTKKDIDFIEEKFREIFQDIEREPELLNVNEEADGLSLEEKIDDLVDEENQREYNEELLGGE
jgi:hypothetical protein